jgi:hypothetical protein
MGPTVVLDAAGEIVRTGKSWHYGFWHIGNPVMHQDDAYLPIGDVLPKGQPQDHA